MDPSVILTAENPKMRTLRRWMGGCATLALVFAVQGCDSGGGGAPPVSSSHDLVKVTGTVKINGAPATGGKVTFDGANTARKDVAPKTADIDKDGKFEIETVTGENRVTVNTPETAKDTKLMMNQKMVDVKAGASVDIEVP